jgi:hypothetical protein
VIAGIPDAIVEAVIYTDILVIGRAVTISIRGSWRRRRRLDNLFRPPDGSTCKIGIVVRQQKCCHDENDEGDGCGNDDLPI